MKNIIIYESKIINIKINECHAKGRKTRIFSVRRDDLKGMSHLLGTIEWDGAWWQYVFIPDKQTKWSAGCLKGIYDFLEKINKQQRLKWKNKNRI